MNIRKAQIEDLDALYQLEQQCFSADRMSKRSFRNQIQQDHNLLLIVDINSTLVAYGLVFLRQGTSLARLYSIAVSPDYLGKGIGRKLLQQAELLAAEQGRMFMRLEVRKDNESAIGLYQSMGYRQFGLYTDYYEDHADALRMQKRIVPSDRIEEHLSDPHHPVHYYEQSTDFTCGSASLMMAMKELQPALILDQQMELQIWREATTIFMTSGHGGCGPHGLAYAARKRGFDVDVYVNQSGPLFLEGVRSDKKKEILSMVHADFLQKLAELNVPIHHDSLSLFQLKKLLDEGHMPLVLISTYRFDRKKAPHWVLIVDMDEHFVYINDPEADDEMEAAQISQLDKHYLPIPKASFEMMLHFGQNRLRCAVIIKKHD